MTIAIQKGQYGVRVAATREDIAACQALRHRCFFGTAGLDRDAFDAACQHVMIANEAGLVCTFRIMLFTSGKALSQSYAAQSYDLAGLAAQDAPRLEIGRFCIDPKIPDADVLRLAWGAITQIVDDNDVRFLFGCASFEGTDPAPYDAAFALLAQRFCAPQDWAPKIKSPEVVPLQAGSTHRAAQQMPPLLRSYLSMGGKVSDHAVVDRQMQTLHVFTGLDVSQIPPLRAKALRALVGASGGDI